MKISEPGYEEIAKAYVDLTITEPFVIQPSRTVFILPLSQYHFKLAKVTLKNNEMDFTPIALPNDKYDWFIEEADLKYGLMN